MKSTLKVKNDYLIFKHVQTCQKGNKRRALPNAGAGQAGDKAETFASIFCFACDLIHHAMRMRKAIFCSTSSSPSVETVWQNVSEIGGRQLTVGKMPTFWLFDTPIENHQKWRQFFLKKLNIFGLKNIDFCNEPKIANISHCAYQRYDDISSTYIQDT